MHLAQRRKKQTSAFCHPLPVWGVFVCYEKKNILVRFSILYIYTHKVKHTQKFQRCRLAEYKLRVTKSHFAETLLDKTKQRRISECATFLSFRFSILKWNMTIDMRPNSQFIYCSNLVCRHWVALWDVDFEFSLLSGEWLIHGLEILSAWWLNWRS